MRLKFSLCHAWLWRFTRCTMLWSSSCLPMLDARASADAMSCSTQAAAQAALLRFQAAASDAEAPTQPNQPPTRGPSATAVIVIEPVADIENETASREATDGEGCGFDDMLGSQEDAELADGVNNAAGVPAGSRSPAQDVLPGRSVNVRGVAERLPGVAASWPDPRMPVQMPARPNRPCIDLTISDDDSDEAPVQHAPARRKTELSGVPSWSCKFCTVINSGRQERCAVCDQWRYSFGGPAAASSLPV